MQASLRDKILETRNNLIFFVGVTLYDFPDTLNMHHCNAETSELKREAEFRFDTHRILTSVIT